MSWLRPRSPVPALDPAERGPIRVELVIVFAVTLGMAGLTSLLTLLDSLLAPVPIRDQTVAINVPLARAGLIDLAKQLLAALRLLAWGALGAYLLYRAGVKLAAVGLDGTRKGRDSAAGVGLAALIGLPGLAFYLAAHAAGANLAVAPSTLDDTWWRPIALVLLAIGNAWAEEVLVVGYLLTRLRHLGLSENASLLVSALVRGSYHLYQGFGGFIGNVVMGLVFGRVWQRTNRLWPLVIAHTLLDVVAFVGYALLRDRISWLP
ncbi:CPBP family intramembrane glutamic endopeptidase [Actinokineospora sp. NPDC004072]